MQLYEFAPTRSIRVRWMLQELGIDFESVTVNIEAGEHRHPEFLKLNPTGRVPVLVDDDLVLTESVAILLYLAEKYPHKGLLPTDILERSQVYRWLLFTTAEMEQPLWRIWYHTGVYPEHLRLTAEVSLARQDFTDLVAMLEDYMQGRQFIVGNTVTVADFASAYTLDWANELRLLDECPHLRQYNRANVCSTNAPLRIAAALKSINAPRRLLWEQQE
ncbi:MAG: glutathione S-transferase family protein [Calothrix sp. SM1_7_51]|nr:glutathione S-transferase family protein [Calothrix sp. SM1_7_51]